MFHSADESSVLLPQTNGSGHVSILRAFPNRTTSVRAQQLNAPGLSVNSPLVGLIEHERSGYWAHVVKHSTNLEAK